MPVCLPHDHMQEVVSNLPSSHVRHKPPYTPVSHLGLQNLSETWLHTRERGAPDLVRPMRHYIKILVHFIYSFTLQYFTVYRPICCHCTYYMH